VVVCNQVCPSCQYLLTTPCPSSHPCPLTVLTRPDDATLYLNFFFPKSICLWAVLTLLWCVKFFPPRIRTVLCDLVCLSSAVLNTVCGCWTAVSPLAEPSCDSSSPPTTEGAPPDPFSTNPIKFRSYLLSPPCVFFFYPSRTTCVVTIGRFLCSRSTSDSFDACSGQAPPQHLQVFPCPLSLSSQSTSFVATFPPPFSLMTSFVPENRYDRLPFPLSCVLSTGPVTYSLFPHVFLAQLRDP